MTYQIELAPHAQRQLKKLEKPVRARIYEKLDKLKANPRPAGVEKLQDGTVDYYRVRVGDYRIVYEIEDKVATVLVVKIGDRKQIYRR